MTKTIERRQIEATTARIELRGADDEMKTIVGYAAVFYREDKPETVYRMWADYEERIAPTAFDRAIREAHDARGLFNHDSANLLGTVSNGTVKLSVDDVGLRYEIPIDANDPDHQRVAAKIKRGDLSGSSFAFSNASSDWEQREENGEVVHVRNVTDLDLFDVGPVTYPAYQASTTGLRTAVESKAELMEARSALDDMQKAINAKRMSEQVNMQADFIKSS